MATLDKEKKSSRLLASRRYTHETLTAAQEAFTNVLDLQSSEIYTEAGYIPSSGLPYSGSADINSTYTSGSKSIMKYWYRQKLTKSNTNNEVWFFLNPTGSDSGIGAQLIDSNQQTSFISPKYSTSALATSTTEDTTPGYLAALYKSSAVSHSLQTGSLDGDDIVSTNDYQFDYKTGVLQFMNSSVDPTNSDYLYMSVYQYVGKTLATGLEVQGDIEATGNITAQQYIISSSVTNITTQAISGSTMFGNTTDDTHKLTGSLYIKGGLTVENLGTLTNRDDSGTLDLGDAFN